MYRQLRGDGIIAFSDPAGAKACLALATLLLRDQPGRDLRLFSNRDYGFYGDWPLAVEIAEAPPQTLAGGWLFTGTSDPAFSGGYELAFLRAASARAIPSWAFVDHWLSLAERFDDGRGAILPDHIVLPDARARDAALAQGLPAERLVVHANPYLDYIRELWRPRRTPAETAERLGVRPPILLFAPDPISLEPGRWGFSEGTALADLVRIAATLPHVALVVKAHPLQPPEPWTEGAELARRLGVTLTIVDRQGESLELMAAASVIVGFHSNFLIEAAALGRPILRYFPASPERDAIAHLEVGERVGSAAELAGRLAALLPAAAGAEAG